MSPLPYSLEITFCLPSVARYSLINKSMAINMIEPFSANSGCVIEENNNAMYVTPVAIIAFKRNLSFSICNAVKQFLKNGIALNRQ